MTGFAFGTSLLEFAASMADFGVQWLVQSTLVLAAGLSAAAMLKSRGPAIQSAVYRTTLVATLACPVVAYVLSSAGLTVISLHLPSMNVESQELVPVVTPFLAVPSASVQPQGAPSTAPPPPNVLESAERRESPIPLASPTVPLDASSRKFEISRESLPQAPPAVTSVAEIAPIAQSFEMHTVIKTRSEIAVAVLLFCLAWSGACGMRLTRLFFEYVQLSRVRRTAAPASDDESRLCTEIAAQMKTVAPSLVRTPYVSSPCLTGIFDPTVLLPEEMLADLSAVLVHELAHIARDDVRWNLLRHMAIALLFPQPLLWWLSRRLEAAAEQVCDDHVVQFGADRRAYAETLLNLAERTMLPASPAVVSLVTLRSVLSRRITRILDQSSRLSLSVGLTALCLIVIVGISAALVAGSFGPGSRSSTPIDDSTTSDAAEGADETAEIETSTTAVVNSKQVTGTVVYADGQQPAAGAHVVLVGRMRLAHRAGCFMAPGEMTVLGQTRVGNDGRFALGIDRLSSSAFRRVQLLVRSGTSALAWRDVGLDVGPSNFDIVLVEPRETRGRLMTLEGAPAGGVHVEVDKIGRESTGEFQAAESMRAPLPREVWPMDVTTDSNGWFSIPGIAPDMDVMLWVDQEPYAKHWWHWKAGDPSTHVQPLAPAQIIEGTVVAADTGDALANVRLTAYQAGDEFRYGMRGIDGGADENGHFRLNPFPARLYNVTAFGPEATSYLARKLSIEWPETKREHTLRIELVRGVLLHGTTVEAPDGKPVAQARVEYQPGRTNKFITDETVTGWQTPVVTDEQGRFAMAVPPGPGFITVQSNSPGYVAREVSSNTLREGKPGGERWYVHGHAAFDLANDARDYPLEVKLSPGGTIEADITLADDTVPESLLVYHHGMLSLNSNTDTHHAPQSVQGGHITIRGVPADEKLSVFLLDPQRKQGRAIALSAQDAAQPVRVQLEKCGAATLRCVDGQGRPVPGAQALLHIVFARGRSRYLSDRSEGLWGDDEILANFDRVNHWDRFAGADGLIRLDALIPGVEYWLGGSDEKGRLILDRTIKVQAGEDQQLSDYVLHSDSELRHAEETWLKLQKTKTPAEKPAADATSSSDNAVAPDDLLLVRGYVIDPEGKAFTGADIVAVRWYWDGQDPKVPLARTKSDASGAFEISFRKSQYEKNVGNPDQWKHTAIAALADGFGPAWMYYRELKAGEQTTLKLVNDYPIEGRIVDLEGRPVTGVNLHVESIQGNSKENLTRWIDAMRKGIGYFGGQPYDPPDRWLFATSLSPGGALRTDEQGRFRLTGCGRNRVVDIKLTAPGIVATDWHVCTSDVAPFDVDFSDGNLKQVHKYYGARFQCGVEPSHPIVGIVRDAVTKRPLAGVRVVGDQLAGLNLGGLHATETVSAADGSYRLDGMPKGEGNRILVMPSDEQPYFMRELKVPTGPGLEPVSFDIDLHRGIWVTGRLTDKVSGQPVQARMFYVPWPNNPHIEGLPEFHQNHLAGPQMRYETDRNGQFKLVGLPGRGLVEAECIDKPYPHGQGVREIADLPSEEMFRNVAGVFAPTDRFPTIVREINLANDALQASVDITLDPGQRLTVKCVDPQGRPISGTRVTGLHPRTHYFVEEDAPTEFQVVALAPNEKRWLMVHHNGRQLGKAAEVSITDAKDGVMVVTLDRCATVKGRLLDKDDEPLAGAQIEFVPTGENHFSTELPRATADENGRFENPNVLPGCAYTVGCRSPGIRHEVVAKQLAVAAGETIDLGEFDVTAKERPEPKRTPAVLSEPKPSLTKSPAEGVGVRLRGQVLSPDGKPLAGATVRTKQVRLDADDFERAPPRTVQADSRGQFEVVLDITREQLTKWPAKWPVGVVAAFAPGFGPAWTLRFPGDIDQKTTLRLVEDQVIEGRIVGLEGQPLAGVHAQVTSIETNEKEDLTAWFDALRRGIPQQEAASLAEPRRLMGTYPNAALPEHDPIQIEAVTNSDGRLRLAGIGRGRLAYVKLSGAGIATTRQWFVAAPMEPLNVRPTDSNIQLQQTYYGTPFQFVAAASQPVEGTVRDAKTGQPLSGAWIISDMLAGSRISANHLIRTKSDALGRYRLDGMPQGAGNRITVVADQFDPYFVREFDVPSGDSFAPVKLDLDLYRGVWIHGRVMERSSGRIARGQMFYLPWPDNAAAEGIRRFNPEVMRNDDFPGRQMVDPDGRYRVVGLPGRGLVGFRNLELHHPIPARQGVNEIADLPPDEVFRKFSGMLTPRAAIVTAIKAVDVGNSDAITTADFVLDEGDKITLNVVDPAGQPLGGLMTAGLWPVGAYYDRENLGPRLEVLALAPDEERTVFIEHTDRKLAKWLRVSRKEHGAGPVVVSLEPSATVTGRLTDHDGEPLVGARVTFYFFTGPNYLDRTKDLITDAEGRFKNENVVAGAKHQVSCSSRLGSKSVTNSLTVTAGESVDLGDIDLTVEKRPEPKRALASARFSVTGTFSPNAPQNLEAARQGGTTSGKPERFTYSGKVLDPNGAPATAARILMIYYTPARVGAKLLGQTRHDGTFEATVSSDAFDTEESNEPWVTAYLVATAEGDGVGWSMAAPFETTGRFVANMRARPGYSERLAKSPIDKTIRLVKDDVPIEGRVVSLEGKGIAGASVRVVEISSSGQQSLDGWLDAVEKKKADDYETRRYVDDALRGLNIPEQIGGLFSKIVTDVDGKFQIQGIGRERIVTLQIESPGIETRQVFARTRTGPLLRVARQIDNPSLGEVAYYGASFTHVAAPSRAVRGVIKDKDTGKPLAGYSVHASKLAGETVHGWPNAFVRTTTDAQGRYELSGLPMGANELVVAPPTNEPYLATEKPVDTSPGREAAQLDFELKRGVWIRGRVIDATTGKPLRGRLEYFAFQTNQFLKSAPQLASAYALTGQYRADADGRFAIPGLPGPGLVSVMVDNHYDYPRGAGVDRITEGRQDQSPGMFATTPYSFVGVNCHAAAQVDASEGTESVELNFQLIGGKRLEGTILDPAGEPLKGAMFFGEGDTSGWHLLSDASFLVHNVQPGKARRLQFYQTDRRLAGTLLLTGQEEGPLSIKLAPWGAAKGRLQLSEGETTEGVRLVNLLKVARTWEGNVLPQMPYALSPDGHFAIDGLSPEANYGISAIKGGRYLGTVIESFQVASGETKDLGELKINREKE